MDVGILCGMGVGMVSDAYSLACSTGIGVGFVLDDRVSYEYSLCCVGIRNCTSSGVSTYVSSSTGIDTGTGIGTGVGVGVGIGIGIGVGIGFGVGIDIGIGIGAR